MSVDMSAAWIVDVKSSLFMSEWKSIACNFSIWDRGQTEQTHYKQIYECVCGCVCVCVCVLAYKTTILTVSNALMRQREKKK